MDDTRFESFSHYYFSPYKRGSSVTPSSSPLKKSGGSPAQKKGIRHDLRNAFGRPGQDEDETEESEEDDENQKSKKVTYCFPIQFFSILNNSIHAVKRTIFVVICNILKRLVG